MGLTVLDAGVVIAVLDRGDRHHDAALAALATGQQVDAELVLPASAYAEALVHPSSVGRDAVAIVDDLLDRLPVLVAALDRPTGAIAAGLRARHHTLRIPDALVIATAVAMGADRLVTTDRRWPTRRALRLRAELEVLGR